jgi:orotidine-5'-phosphate decarboxylase
MSNFADRLVEAIRRKRSTVVVGLDPRLDLLPSDLRLRHGAGGTARPAAASRAILAFNKKVIDAVAPHAVAVKPQSAFYEIYGHEGVDAFEATCAYAADRGLLVIADVKRGDVPDTAEAYARAYLSPDSPVDALTVNPLFGRDGTEPFLKAAAATGRGVFILVHTSNPSSKEIQDLSVRGQPLYLAIADMVRAWGEGEGLVGRSGYSSIGAVAGATFPEQAKEIRSILPRAFLLVPGYGAQGATAKDLGVYYNADGLGAVVNASRSVIFAYTRSPGRETYGEKRWEEAVAAAARTMKEELQPYLKG